MKNSSKSRKKIYFSIKINGDEWNQIKPEPKMDSDRVDQRMNDSWTHIVNEKIWGVRSLPCAFTFEKQKFYKRDEFPYFEIFGHCNARSCFQKITGKCMKLEDDGVVIDLNCFDTANPLKRHTRRLPLSGYRRFQTKKDLLGKKSAQLRKKRANELLNDSGGDCPPLQTTAVFATARQESRDDEIGLKSYAGDPITSTLAMMKDMSSIRLFSTVPFYVYYWTENQLDLWKEINTLNQFISIDASGCFVKTPIIYEDNKSSAVFLYNIVTHLENKIYTICQCLSSVHDTDSIFSWLFCWIQSGAPVPREAVVDCSRALLNGLCRAFNGIYYDMYLETCFRIVTKITSIDNLPYCLIKRDRAHLIKGLCKSKYFERENWVKKDFYVHCIGYALRVDDLKLFEDIMTALFIVCESEYSDEDTECARRKEWLSKKVGDFNYKVYYEINDEEDDAKEEENYDYLNFEVECPESSNIKSYVYSIYNHAVAVCSEVNNQSKEPNNYYLPKISDFFILLFVQFPAWTNIMNSFFSSKNDVSSTCRSECHYRIMRNDDQMCCPISFNRFLLKHIDDINGATKLGRTVTKRLLEVNSVKEFGNTHNVMQKFHSFDSLSEPAGRSPLGRSPGRSPLDNVDRENKKTDIDLDTKVLKENTESNYKSVTTIVRHNSNQHPAGQIYGKENVPSYYFNDLVIHYMQYVKDHDFTVAFYLCTDIPANIFSMRMQKKSILSGEVTLVP